jgi:hypothetical protein
LGHNYGGQMQNIQVQVSLDLIVPDDEKANQIEIVQELLDKLYVGVEHYEHDVFSVTNLQLLSFQQGEQ